MILVVLYLLWLDGSASVFAQKAEEVLEVSAAFSRSSGLFAQSVALKTAHLDYGQSRRVFFNLRFLVFRFTHTGFIPHGQTLRFTRACRCHPSRREKGGRRPGYDYQSPTNHPSHLGPSVRPVPSLLRASSHNCFASLGAVSNWVRITVRAQSVLAGTFLATLSMSDVSITRCE